MRTRLYGEFPVFSDTGVPGREKNVQACAYPWLCTYVSSRKST